MIRCTPQSICSWDFQLEGEGHRASTQCNWASEQGSIVADGVDFDVSKHGLGSGRWTLERAGEVITTAQKATLRRTFELESPMGPLLLQAESMFGRAFRLERSGRAVASVRTEHAFTRRATIELHEVDLHWPTVCFSFWLAVVTWRRAARSN